MKPPMPDKPPYGTIRVARAIKESRPVSAREWAMRRGMAIANTHLSGEAFEMRAALACDIAEALQSAFDAALALRESGE